MLYRHCYIPTADKPVVLKFSKGKNKVNEIYQHNKETSALHLCEFIPNECSFLIQVFCFKVCDYLTMLCPKKKFICCSFTAMTTQQAPVPKLWKSHNQYLTCLPFALTTVADPCLTEWTSYLIIMSPCCVTTAGISLSRKCDVTECQSRPWVVTYGRSVLVESVVTSLALNLSPGRLNVLDIVLNCLDLWTLCTTACSMPTAR